MSGTDGATATAAGTATDAAAATTTTSAGNTTTDTGTAAAGTGTAAAAQTAPTIEQLQADVDKWKAHSRKNEAALKAKNDGDDTRNKLLLEVAQKLGIESAGGQPDAAAITAQLDAANRETKVRSNELTVLRAASRLGADGDALLDSRTFMAQVDGLDGPEAIEAAIKLAVAQSPARYGRSAQNAADGTSAAAATQTATASSAGTFDGAQNGARQWTQADVNNATPAQVTEAMNKGLLQALLSS